jgi:hypothetical protein
LKVFKLRPSLGTLNQISFSPLGSFFKTNSHIEGEGAKLSKKKLLFDSANHKRIPSRNIL